MAQNHIGPEAVFDFVTSSEDPAISGIDLTTDDGYQKAYRLLVASLGGGEAVKAAREAQDYTVLLLNHTEGTFTVIGNSKGSAGRAAEDPSKWNDLQRMVARAEITVRVLAKKGVLATAMKVLTSDFRGA